MKTAKIGKKLPHRYDNEMRVPIENGLGLEPGSRHFVFRSAAMHRMYAIAGRVAGSDASVLIYGESGTGKELFARLLHRLSDRSAHPFAPVNCGVLQGELFADRFFGHESGAFTGAARPRKGAFEAAGSGTLFLDEAGEIPPANQADFLRVLEERCFRRMGGEKDLPFQARIIAATNRPLMQMVQEGRFRADLFYRLNVVPVSLPPLRSRPDDIGLLLEHFLTQFRHRYHRPELVLHEEVTDMLRGYHWPGNVRELRNLLERLVLLAEKPVIGPEHIPPDIRLQAEDDAGLTIARGKARAPASLHAETPLPESLLLSDAVRNAEIRAILRAFAQSGRNKGNTARLLGVSPRTLRYKLSEYQLDI